MYRRIKTEAPKDDQGPRYIHSATTSAASPPCDVAPTASSAAQAWEDRAEIRSDVLLDTAPASGPTIPSFGVLYRRFPRSVTPCTTMTLVPASPPRNDHPGSTWSSTTSSATLLSLPVRLRLLVVQPIPCVRIELFGVGSEGKVMGMMGEPRRRIFELKAVGLVAVVLYCALHNLGHSPPNRRTEG